MKKKILALIISSVAVSVAIYCYYQKPTESNVIAVPQKVHFEGKKNLSCTAEAISSLKLTLNGVLLWQKPHEELFNMQGVVPTLDRRFKGKNIVPLALLLEGQNAITSIKVIPCDGVNTLMSINEVLAESGGFFLGQNRKGRAKLLKYSGNQRYTTLNKNIVHVELVSR